MTHSVIITAGGSGKRMGAGVPKQFLLLEDRPMLMRTITLFWEAMPEIQVILVLPREHIDSWKSLCKEYSFQLKHQITTGGKERFHSIKNGLQLADGKIIGVHDAVRPLVSPEVIRRSFELAAEKGSAVPVMDIKDTLRKVDGEGSVTVDRSLYHRVQTPQCFKRDWLLKAYEQDFSDHFTDDGSVVEACGYPIYLTKGNEENIKITTPLDLKIASLLLL